VGFDIVIVSKAGGCSLAFCCWQSLKAKLAGTLYVANRKLAVAKDPTMPATSKAH
jgi:hypothetical protein